MDPGAPLSTTPAPPAAARGDTVPKIVYVLYLASLINGVTAIVGVILAYVNAANAPEPIRSHYRFQIRTFWIGVLYGFVSFLLMFVLIGFLTGAFTVVWLIVRAVKGLQRLDRGEPYPNADTWLW